MKIAYLDCASGISGDMLLGALMDAGVELGAIQEGIDSLGLPDCRLTSAEVRRRGFRGLKVQVQHAPEKAHRHLHHITGMIDGSGLTERQKDLARRVFIRLGEAEAKVHGTTLQKVHFHEVGAVDSIADIVGAAIGWDLLGAQRLVCSPIPTGQGTIEIAHGRVSLPAPATAELLRGVPLAASDVQAELTTPTGAALVATLVDEFGGLPAMTIEGIGCGAGERDLPQQPNLLRLLVGQAGPAEGSLLADQVCVLQTNLDDVTGQVIGDCSERLLAAGGLDVYTTPIQMKKNRPAIQLTVLCRPADADQLEQILFRETSTLGVRRWLAGRHKLPRTPHSVGTAWGPVAGKVATLPDGERRFWPEYDDCRRVALQHQVPLQQVMQAACQAFTASRAAE